MTLESQGLRFAAGKERPCSNHSLRNLDSTLSLSEISLALRKRRLRCSDGGKEKVNDI